MDKSQIIKVKCNGSICRITVPKATNENLIPYASLEDRIRSSFKLPPADVISLTYTDVEGDFVVLSSDADIEEALVYQHLNPLHVELRVEKGTDMAARIPSLETSSAPHQENEKEGPLMSNSKSHETQNPVNGIPIQNGFNPKPVSNGAASGLRSGGEYTVQPGDTMFDIANELGIQLQELIDVNPGVKKPTLIAPGQVLNLP